MNIPNIGPYASVVGEEQTARRLVYNRDYGNIVTTTVQANKVSTQATPYNRLQPLCGEFGNHLPVTADQDFIALNPQSTLAWDQRQQVPVCEYQNYSLERLPTANDTMPQVEVMQALNKTLNK